MPTALVWVLMPLIAAQLTEWNALAFSMLATAMLFGAYPLTRSALGLGIRSAWFSR